MPSQAQIEALINQQLNGYVGQAYRIKFLTSEKGLTLNGKICDAIGHNGDRIEVRVRDDGSEMRLKLCNLCPLSAPTFPSSDTMPIPDEEIVKRLKDVLAHPTGDIYMRPDTSARANYVKKHVMQGQVPPPTRCMDAMVPDDQLDDMVSFLAKLRPCCNRDDGLVDFRHFHEGLMGNGSTCPICTEVTDPTKPALGFPCGHVFHRHCAIPWLERNNTCPTCRCQLGMPGEEYVEMFDYEQRLTVRLNEWFISGMCERCQAVFQEQNPLCVVRGPNGENTLVPRDQL